MTSHGFMPPSWAIFYAYFPSAYRGSVDVTNGLDKLLVVLSLSVVKGRMISAKVTAGTDGRDTGATLRGLVTISAELPQ